MRGNFCNGDDIPAAVLLGLGLFAMVLLGVTVAVSRLG